MWYMYRIYMVHICSEFHGAFCVIQFFCRTNSNLIQIYYRESCIEIYCSQDDVNTIRMSFQRIGCCGWKRNLYLCRCYASIFIYLFFLKKIFSEARIKTAVVTKLIFSWIRLTLQSPHENVSKEVCCPTSVGLLTLT